MADRPIIDIQVNADQFSHFVDLFNDYHAKLKEMPEAWQQLNAAMEGAGDAGEQLAAGALTGREALALAAAQAVIVSEELVKAVKAQDALGDSSHATNKRMSELAKTAKGLAGEISGIGKWVLNLGAGALAGLGLGAIAGGFGIGELTNTLYQRGRTAQGVGLSPGELASFQAYGQQFLGEDALHSAAAAQITYQSAAPLAMLGIDFRKATDLSASDLAFEELKGAIKNWQDAQKTGTPPESSPFVKAYVDLGGNLEDVRRAILQGGIPAVTRAQEEVRTQASAMDYDMRPWASFKFQLDAAGKTIEAVFGRALTPLIPEFEKLSIEAVNAFAAFAKSKEFTLLIDDVKKGLESFIAWIEDPKTKKGWDAFVAGAELVGSEIMAVAEKLKWLLPQQPPPNMGKPPRPGMVISQNVWDRGLWVDPKTGERYDPKTKTWVGSAWAQAGASAWDLFKSKTGITDFGIPKSGYTPVNNPLDITTGSSGGRLIFPQFDNVDQGIRAGAQRLENYPKNWNAKTMAEIIPIWAGPETPGGITHAEYIANVEKLSGVSSKEPIADYTRAQLAEVIAAMSRIEGTAVVSADQVMHALYGSSDHVAKKHTDRIVKAVQKRYSGPHPMQISITNSTASKVAVSANAMATG